MLTITVLEGSKVVYHHVLACNSKVNQAHAMFRELAYADIGYWMNGESTRFII